MREGPKSPDGSIENNALALLLSEIRSLRVQLERSIQTNNALRVKLEEQLKRKTTQFPAKSPHISVVRQLNLTSGAENGNVFVVHYINIRIINNSTNSIISIYIYTCTCLYLLFSLKYHCLHCYIYDIIHMTQSPI